MDTFSESKLNPQYSVFILLLLISSLLLLSFPAWSQEAESCQSAKCHDDIGKQKWVHGPAAAGECKICHAKVGKHKFKLTQQGSLLCYECHEPLVNEAHVHKPVKDGDCTGCHDPHQSNNRYSLRKPAGPQLCFLCHDDTITKHKFLHRPVADGDCLGCHNSHSSPNKNLLKKVGMELCYSCHSEIKQALDSKAHVHSAAEDSCTESCHSPHGGPVKFMLKAKKNVREVCFECHDEVAAEVKAGVRHSPVVKDGECANCHNPHAADFEPLLKLEPLKMCLKCHNRSVKGGDGAQLMDMAKLLKANPDHHGPIKDSDCSKCHNPHGSNSFRMLTHDYPAKFYAPFKLESFALCTKCHEKDTFLKARTAQHTDFRNGDQNLHFLHVNRKVKGRTCRACHETHASKSPRHIRESVPFGKWKLPTNFKKSKTGGYCLPGCHKEKKYDRNKPVKY
ncbi:cytochrome C [Oligoflexia bacterium]|nr:cytochrome C [Oligoflexia bacterium]